MKILKRVHFLKDHRWQPPQNIISKIEELSLDQKISMMSGDIPFAQGLKDMLENDFYHKHAFPGGEIPEKNIEGIKFIDGPRGVVLFGGATMFPVPMARGASFDPELEYRIGNAIGTEHKALGGNLFGGVCINLLRHPAWGRAQETYGEDPELLAQMGIALTKGAQQHVMACVKHFAVNSMENARFQVDVVVSETVLHEIYFPHFKRVVQEGDVASVMSSYNALNGEWCGQNKWLLNGILKSSWGFSGFILTDFLFGMRDAKTAVLAGQDLEMPFHMHYDRFLHDLVKSGEIPLTAIDDACARLLYQQKRFADLPVPHLDKVGCETHIQLSREAAARSFVLIKNQKNTNGHCVLPVTKNQSIALIGDLANTPNIGDHGSSDGRPDYVVTPLEGLQQHLSEHQTLAYNDGTDIKAAVELARLNDVAILVVGYTAKDEGEYIAPISMGPFADGIKPPRALNNLFKIKALKPLWRKIVEWASERKLKKQDINNNESFDRGGDRRSLKLQPHHESLIKAVSAVNPNTVVLIMAGSAVTMENWRHDVSAIMNVWYPGMQGGNAIADVIFGDLSPSGKLPFTLPEDAADLPELDIDATTIEYDAWHGYQRFAKYGYKAAYPFGHGLNYADLTWLQSSLNKTRFAEHDEIIMKIEIQNASDIDCYETVLCFLKSQQNDREYPPIELKGFSSKRLAAKSNQLISVSVPIANIAYYSEEQSMMTYTPGSYEIALCKHAEDSSAVWHPIVLE